MAYNKVSTHRTFGLKAATNASGCIRYIETDIVTWSAQAITLRNDGWQSVTTKRKMNQAALQFGLNFGVYQKAGNWFVTYAGQTMPFVDGMVLSRVAQAA